MPRTPWRHLLLLTAAAFLLLVASLATDFHGRHTHPGWGMALWAAVFWSAEQFIGVLPAVGGVALGANIFSRGSARAGAAVLAAVLAAMVALDLWGEPAIERANARVARREAARWPMPSD